MSTKDNSIVNLVLVKIIGKALGTMLAIALLFLSSCGAECVKRHSPIMPFAVYPAKDTIHIGDTLWLEAQIPHIMKDFETGDLADYKSVDFNSYFNIQIITDTARYLSDQPYPFYATHNFTLIKSIGDFIGDKVCRIDYVNRNDSFLLKVGFVAQKEGFYRLDLSYNPGSIAHGPQIIEMGDEHCTHKLNTLCQSINNGSSTLYRATDKGYRVWVSPDPTKLEKWIYHNRIYFFSVAK